MVNAEEADLRLNRLGLLATLHAGDEPRGRPVAAGHLMRHAMKLVILDRDGTINDDSDDFIKSPEEWKPLPGALEAIARLNHAGWHVVIATNQSGLGRGLFDVASLNAMHAKMHKLLAAQSAAASTRCSTARTRPDEGCDCRKPLPGLFEQIGERYGVDLQRRAGGRRQPARPAGRRRRGLRAAPGADRQGRSAARPAAARRPIPPGTQVHDDLAAFADCLLARAAPAPRRRLS